MSVPASYGFDHLERMSDHRGLFEHAAGTVRREEHGYCTDDNARLVVVASREPHVGAPPRLGRLALGFVLDAQSPDGRCRNRMDRTGRWTDAPATDDCWGRALWALGTAAAHHPDPLVRLRSLGAFASGARQRSTWPHAMAFASLGAAEVITIDPGQRAARRLLADALDAIGPIPHDRAWRWPLARLTYANPTLAEAVIAAGAALGRADDVRRGLTMLAWLLELETPAGHLSVTGAGGRGPGEAGPQFDQQPIEVAALADACWRACAVTGDQGWGRGIALAAAWFGGDNDAGLEMFDAASGGGYDGLEREGVNLNQGAESTLAFISTMQRARAFAPAS